MSSMVKSMVALTSLLGLSAASANAQYPAASTFEVVSPTNVSAPITFGTPTSSGASCPQCGQIHSPSSPINHQANFYSSAPVASSFPSSASPSFQTGTVRRTSYAQPTTHAEPIRATSGSVQNVLATLNAQRARQGIRALRYDPTLQAVAQRRALAMAASGLKSHPPGSYAPGRYEGVGWSSSYAPSGVSACFTSDPRMVAAGAAMATGRDGVYFAVVYR